ncbi:hypothetical protein J8273_5661 [Carpediemonas membranifera]|uniref:VWFA domain-containing protein n=1 Tax=Carpediemonas membranifera TaxID=201153 RepID=A0A8J6E1E3_9EUKA|nr:hypothetical protein J8273_5661 [Carpediemonas membranifera]|eukprot:KAG9392951.1 hypothetical protein J8273_5661 [Carpediemonas membranifera]
MKTLAITLIVALLCGLSYQDVTTLSPSVPSALELFNEGYDYLDSVISPWQHICSHQAHDVVLVVDVATLDLSDRYPILSAFATWIPQLRANDDRIGLVLMGSNTGVYPATNSELRLKKPDEVVLDIGYLLAATDNDLVWSLTVTHEMADLDTALEQALAAFVDSDSDRIPSIYFVLGDEPSWNSTSEAFTNLTSRGTVMGGLAVSDGAKDVLDTLKGESDGPSVGLDGYTIIDRQQEAMKAIASGFNELVDGDCDFDTVELVITAILVIVGIILAIPVTAVLLLCCCSLSACCITCCACVVVQTRIHRRQVLKRQQIAQLNQQRQRQATQAIARPVGYGAYVPTGQYGQRAVYPMYPPTGQGYRNRK